MIRLSAQRLSTTAIGRTRPPVAGAAVPEVRYEPVSRQFVPDSIVRQIQELIASRALKPGEKIASERELAAALRVSRSAVREAVKMMASLGILEVRQGSGTFVKEAQHLPLADLSQFGSEERRRMLLQATAARKLIDVEAAGQAAKAATPEHVSQIELYLKASLTEPLRTKRQYSLDLGFEALIAAATGNPYLIELQKSAHAMFASAWTSGGFIPRPAEERNRQHQLIFEAIRRGDPKLARSVMANHFKLGIENFDEAGV